MAVMPLYRKAACFGDAAPHGNVAIPFFAGTGGPYAEGGESVAGQWGSRRIATSVQRTACLRGHYPLTTTKVDGAEGKPEEGGRSLSSKGFFRPLRDERYCMCGIFGISGHPEAARMAYFGLYALQHRGQESTGIASYDGKHIRLHAGMGLVPDVYDEAALGQELQGNKAIGHVRYSTSGRSHWPITAT